MRAGMVAMLVSALIHCTPGISEKVQLVSDPAFRLGFEMNATPVGKKVVERVVRTSEAEPVWAIAQWSSRFSLADGKPAQTGRGWELRDAAKFVRFATPPGAEAELVLGMDCRLEYPDGHRAEGEFWPHLLVEQRFKTHPRLDTLESLDFTLDARLTKAERIEGDAYTPRLHAAQCLAYFTVQNMNRDSAGYGDFLWLGVQIYDDRERSEKQIIEGDFDLGKLIYHPARSHYTGADYAHGAWWRFEADLLPIAKEALEAAWERGFTTASQDISDYAIGGMNLGWEVPGIHVVEVEFRNLGVLAKPKSQSP